MITVSIPLSDEMKQSLDARLREGAYASLEDYVGDLIAADLASQEGWVASPELAALLAEGAASGISTRSIDDIIKQGRERWSV